MLAGQEIHLTVTEFELLRVMMLHQGNVLSHRFLLQNAWGQAYGDESDYVRVCVYQLRCKLEADPSHPQYIITEPGSGYVFRLSQP
jgi:two-component system KDP operon response regulator KdpE